MSNRKRTSLWPSFGLGDRVDSAGRRSPVGKRNRKRNKAIAKASRKRNR